MENMKNTFKKTTLAMTMAAAGLVFTGAASADTTVKVSGYLKATAMYTTTNDGSLAGGSVPRSFYVLSATPVGGESSSAFDADARESRFRFVSSTDLGNGEKITGLFELDFQTTTEGNEAVSNSFAPRLRHALIKYGNWSVGQTWSTFMNLGALAESVDFVGVSDGVPFVRQTQVRYSSNGFEFALENPETFAGGVNDDNTVPDMVAAYTTKGDWGHVKVAGLLRQLRAYDPASDSSTSDTGAGIAVSGKIQLDGGNNIVWGINAGSGIGRYIGLASAQDAYFNPTNGDLEAIDTLGYYAAYRHAWDETSRTTVMFAAHDIDVTSAMAQTTTESVYSTRINYIWSPVKPISVGIEYAYAKRELANGADGDLNRIQAMAKYVF